jgi:hypothetical protein
MKRGGRADNFSKKLKHKTNKNLNRQKKFSSTYQNLFFSSPHLFISFLSFHKVQIDFPGKNKTNLKNVSFRKKNKQNNDINSIEIIEDEGTKTKGTITDINKTCY